MREYEITKYKWIITSICVQVMDEYVDKVYEQFISEGGRAQRTVLKEERAKLKAESAAAAPRYKYWLFTSVGDPDQSPSRIRVIRIR